MRRVCSWCQKDLGEKEPFEDPAITSTVCRGCLGELVTPEMRSLLVVRRDAASLYSEFRELLKDRPEVQVILDRRYGERRRSRRPVTKERRSGDRRREGMVISVEGIGLLAPGIIK